MKYNYNYVYRITNKILNKYYYGVRSSDIEPKLDLGVKYFSSSSNKEFRKDQKNHPENYKYKIVRICSSRLEAGALEIKLHEKFNVALNESFYNRAKHSSTGFDTTGVKHSPEHKQKMSEALKGENHYMFGKEHTPKTKLKMSEAAQNMSDEHKQKLSEAHKGKKHTTETRQKMSEAHQNISEENRQKMSKPQEQVECPHCGKIGGISNMKRYHFDNCKCKKYN
jgi:hypothetical protein